MVIGVVLAAGLARRMGEPKLLLSVAGKSVIRHSVEAVLAGGIGRLIVVVPPEHGALSAALEDLRVSLAVNPAPEEGQAGSIRAGIAALPSGTAAALIALGDQPFLPREVIPRLLAEFGGGGRAIVAPRYREGQGNPVLFGAAVFPELLALCGDRGARSVIERDGSRVGWVDFELSMPADLDTREDYERLRESRGPV
ncbi:MAG TPA: nucleotidyltransferase family protein [Methylomirabilota bacterium]|nr:nucleotidyltransferase family protein [Methylomirabilota bacterium]